MDTPDYFALFGLEPKLTLDAADLESRFYALSRKLHPDRFLRAAPAERERALQDSAALNDAYRVLRNPIARAEYLLEREGLAAEDAKQPPPELLEEVFELNEALADARDGASTPELEAARTRFRTLLGETDADVETLSRRYDTGDRAALTDLRSVLMRRKYIAKLLLQVDRVLVL